MKILKIIICFLVVLIASAKAFAYEVSIKADDLEYVQDTNILTAKGNVVMGWQGREVRADSVTFNVATKQMSAVGNVRIEESGNSFAASSIDYNFTEETGTIKNAVINSSLVFMHAQEMNRYKDSGKNAYSISGVTISNCDLDDPHTCFKARSGSVVLGERVTIYNPILYIGKFPVFYLPVVSKSLKGGQGFEIAHLKYTFEPGYTTTGGFSIKNTLEYDFSKSFSAKAYIDYLGSQGYGYGAELDYITKDIKGTLYAYRIDDLIAGMERWTVTPSYFQKINDKWTIQSQGQFMSDAQFNNSFNLDNWDRTMTQLYSYAAITRQGQSSNLLVALQRYDNYDGVNYVTTQLSLPQVTYTYYPKKILGGLTHSFNISYNNNYQEYSADNFFYKNTVSAAYNLMRSFRVGKRLTFQPQVTVAENYADKNDEGYVDPSFLTTYTGSMNARYRPASWMDWNFNYSAGVRSSSNSLNIDSTANDYGIGTNNLTYTNYMYIGTRLTVRNVLSYNFVRYRDDTGMPSPWSPLATEIIYTPKYYITAYLRQTQLLDPMKFQSLQFDLQVGDQDKAYFNFGAFYTDYNDPMMIVQTHQIVNTLGFGFWVTPKWRIDYNIHTTTSLDGTYFRLDDQELKIYRDLHCYNFGVTWRIRANSQEAFFMFNLKTNTPFDRRNLGKDTIDDDQIFYPWR